MEETGIFEIREDCLLVHMPEEVDHHTTKSIRRLADHYLLDYRVQQIVFDFADTMFMDSSGIGIVLGRYKVVSKGGGRLRIINANRRVERILRMAGIFSIAEYRQRRA